MRVVTAANQTIELGELEATPTVSITNYSRRVTDDFGVTTVVERGFSRKLSVRLGLPLENVDALQRNLANLRATPALWVANEQYASLSVQGLYKEFSLDLAVPPLSYCTLTVEGVAETVVPADPGGDPAPDGLSSSLQMIQPVTMTDAVVTNSSVPENDAPVWVTGTGYAKGATVVRAHRMYESLVIGNAGNDPATTTGKWLDVGPTNRWAMFDQALGTTTDAAGSIVVTLNAGAVTALALLDVTAASVRVQGAGYDRTIAVVAGAIPFLDLPSTIGAITVTVTGPGTVTVGTLLVGRLMNLGATEASPTAGITDYSRQVVDDFGNVTVTQRAWAKRMTANALIRTDALDAVFNRLATVRATPSLWIGKQGLDSLTVYGFFKDFSIEVGTMVSKLSLSIEGLSTAAKIEPIGLSQDQIDDINQALALAQSASALITSEASARTSADGALSTRIDNMVATVGSNTTAISTETTARTTADQALGTRIDNISASVSSNTNLCPDVDSWDAVNGGFHNGSPYWGDHIACNNPPAAPYTIPAQSPQIPIAASTTYTFSCDLLAIGGNGSKVYADVYAVDAGGTVIAVLAGTNPAINLDFANGPSRYKMTFATPSNAVAIYLRQVDFQNAAGDLQFTGIRRPKLELGNAATSYTIEGQSIRNAAAIKDEATVRATAVGAVASSVSALSTTVGGHTASITAAQSSINGILAKYGVTLDVNGYITGFQQNNNGVTGNFAINADNFSIGKPGGGARTEYSTGNWRIYDGAGQIRTRMGIW